MTIAEKSRPLYILFLVILVALIVPAKSWQIFSVFKRLRHPPWKFLWSIIYTHCVYNSRLQFSISWTTFFRTTYMYIRKICLLIYLAIRIFFVERCWYFFIKSFRIIYLIMLKFYLYTCNSVISHNASILFFSFLLLSFIGSKLVQWLICEGFEANISQKNLLIYELYKCI